MWDHELACDDSGAALQMGWRRALQPILGASQMGTNSVSASPLARQTGILHAGAARVQRRPANLNPMRLIALLILTFALYAGPSAGVQAQPCPPALPLPDTGSLADAAPAPDRGLLWRLSKDGRESYLYGTVHLGRPQWLRPGPQVSAALRAIDTLALEIDPSDPATRATLRQLTAASSGQPLPDALRAQLSARTRAACLPEQALNGLQPLIQAMTLTLLEARWDGLDAGFALEQILSHQARALRRPIVALETPQQQLDLLLGADPAHTQDMTRDMLTQLEQDRVRPVLLRLIQAWERGDLTELENYEQWCDCIASPQDRIWLRRLNEERNPGMADGIARLHDSGTRVFAAVGALHMTGPRALPLLLANKGFRVERLLSQP
ncbi:MAG: TraB/GumN family protein [Methylibium sp.]|nr:TraB/GumN family protein [Methylibium sp.]